MHYIPRCPLTGYSDGATGYLGAAAGNGFGNVTPTQVQLLSLRLQIREGNIEDSVVTFRVSPFAYFLLGCDDHRNLLLSLLLN